MRLVCSCWHVMPPNRWRYLAEIVEQCAVCGWILNQPAPKED